MSSKQVPQSQNNFRQAIVPRKSSEYSTILRSRKIDINKAMPGLLQFEFPSVPKNMTYKQSIDKIAQIQRAKQAFEKIARQSIYHLLACCQQEFNRLIDQVHRQIQLPAIMELKEQQSHEDISVVNMSSGGQSQRSKDKRKHKFIQKQERSEQRIKHDFKSRQEKIRKHLTFHDFGRQSNLNFKPPGNSGNRRAQ